ncbi:hypothetical protein [Agromyces sp. NPDC049794]|uniref:hypothetical protein n=1 Tax=unclassified Agromyces TaxID=2639701 RepID=UPI0033CD78D7
MSTSSASASGAVHSDPEPSAVLHHSHERRLYRAAGLGGILAFASWLGQPVVVAVLSAAEGDEVPTIELLRSRPYSGVIEAVIFLGMAVGLLAFVQASASLVRNRTGPEPSVWAGIGAAFGWVGAASWILVATASLSPFTSIGLGVAEALPDQAGQTAVLEANALLITAFVIAGALGLAGHALFLATAGRRAGILGWPLAVTAFAAVAALALPFLMPFTPPWGLIGVLLFVLVAGIVFLFRSRRGATR